MGISSTRTVVRSVGVVSLALGCVIGLAVSSAFTAAVQLLVATALVMGGTGVSLDPARVPSDLVHMYVDAMNTNYIAPTHPGEPYNTVAVITPEDFWPVSGLGTFGASVALGRKNLRNCEHASNCAFNPDESAPPNDPAANAGNTYITLGYSQSAVIASLVKRDLLKEFAGDPSASPDVSFVLVSNPMRPNGGILMKATWLTIPILNIPLFGATPTNSCQNGGPCYPTVDIAQQYDILGGDAPNNLTNVLALANSIAGYLFLHSAMQAQNLADASVHQGTYGDTDYYLNPAELLPILLPLQAIGVPRALLLVADAPLRVLIEQAYRRDISPGRPTPQYLIPISDVLSMPVNLLKSIPVGIDDGLQYAGMGRPLGTKPAGPYGVGGDDKELKGLPAGLIPLGSTDGGPNLKATSTSAESSLTSLDAVGVGKPNADTGSVTVADLGEQNAQAVPTPQVVLLPNAVSNPLKSLRSTVGDDIGRVDLKSSAKRPVTDKASARADKQATGDRPAPGHESTLSAGKRHRPGADQAP